MIIYAGTSGGLDDVPANKVGEFEKAFLQHVRTTTHPETPAADPRLRQEGHPGRGQGAPRRQGADHALAVKAQIRPIRTPHTRTWPASRSLRVRIKSVGSIKQITRAMEMVATTKLRRFQDRAMAPSVHRGGHRARRPPGGGARDDVGFDRPAVPKASRGSARSASSSRPRPRPVRRLQLEPVQGARGVAEGAGGRRDFFVYGRKAQSST